VIALRALKGPQIDTAKSTQDANQHHAAGSAIRAMGPLDWDKRRFRAGMKIWHVMHPRFGGDVARQPWIMSPDFKLGHC
jgi:hypothetical protein